MNPAQMWWLTNTSAGRRTLDRIMPNSAIPMVTRRQICAEQGHDLLGDGSCLRCGDREVSAANRNLSSEWGKS